ncbi:malate:quinone oxidoreductase [Cephaloticoccus primus]|uniref:Probable malate:quinone oxidoreductase n=1 Tax=Cephaloticoccus primus TaxID=1548207 RepID=A0A139SRM4_9BACT|nr:malate dehydrogenase (quinone) [Cephaloticoccus primus]KXU37130.1 malate:quinone oxidoreductase [Cephaloticoccus primus]
MPARTHRPAATPPIDSPDVLLVGSGIMSANLAALLKQLDPALTIQVYEATEQLAQEASNGWNNAGTGHAGLCELSYTPNRGPDGEVDVAKAISVFAEFEHSLQFWGYAAAQGMLPEPRRFINPVPHISFVHGQDWVDFLASRHRGLSQHHFFRQMEYSTDRETIARWAPLLLDARDPAVPIAATHMPGGTDVNFGEIARGLLSWLAAQDGCAVTTAHRVVDLKKLDRPQRGWRVSVRDLATGAVRHTHARFVFIGAGGGSLPLLQKAGIAEQRGLGGFPIGGQWLICDNPEIVARHRAKVYGQPLAAAPTMAVPHLDTRILDGRQTLLFGPFGSWTTKFLHRKGRWTDLPRSIRPHNLGTLIKIGLSNLGLIRYLIQQGTQSMQDRLDVLHVFYPGARLADWRLIDAGIRVQAIKKTDGQAGIVHYGTEVITNPEKTISALLGASPGASTSVNIVLEVLENCFAEKLADPAVRERLTQIVPSYSLDLAQPENAERFDALHSQALKRLQLA